MGENLSCQGLISLRSSPLSAPQISSATLLLPPGLLFSSINQMGTLVCTLHSAQISKGLGTVAAYLVQNNTLHKCRLLLFQKKLCHLSIINYH